MLIKSRIYEKKGMTTFVSCRLSSFWSLFSRNNSLNYRVIQYKFTNSNSNDIEIRYVGKTKMCLKGVNTKDCLHFWMLFAYNFQSKLSHTNHILAFPTSWNQKCTILLFQNMPLLNRIPCTLVYFSLRKLLFGAKLLLFDALRCSQKLRVCLKAHSMLTFFPEVLARLKVASEVVLRSVDAINLIESVKEAVSTAEWIGRWKVWNNWVRRKRIYVTLHLT